MEAIQVVAIAVSSAVLLVVLELVRRRLLTEEYSFVWIAGALVLLVLSIWREALHIAASWLQIHYPPALLLLVLLFFTFLGSLVFAVALSRQRAQIERLARELALLEADVRRGRSAERAAPRPGDEPVP